MDPRESALEKLPTPSFLLHVLLPFSEQRKGKWRGEEKSQVAERNRHGQPKQTMSSPRRKPTGRTSNPAWAIGAPETTGTHWRLCLMRRSFPFLL